MAVDRISRVPRPDRRSRDGGCGHSRRSSLSLAASDFLPEPYALNAAVFLCGSIGPQNIWCVQTIFFIHAATNDRRSDAIIVIDPEASPPSPRGLDVQWRVREQTFRPRKQTREVATLRPGAAIDPR